MRLVDGNPMTRTLLLTLIFEVIVYILAIPGMIQVDGLPLLPAFASGIGAALLAGAAAGMLRRPVGWPLAWAAQLAGIALGLLTPWMYVVGGGFAALFLVEFLLGKKIESRH